MTVCTRLCMWAECFQCPIFPEFHGNLRFPGSPWNFSNVSFFLEFPGSPSRFDLIFHNVLFFLVLQEIFDFSVSPNASNVPVFLKGMSCMNFLVPRISGMCGFSRNSKCAHKYDCECGCLAEWAHAYEWAIPRRICRKPRISPARRFPVMMVFI